MNLLGLKDNNKNLEMFNIHKDYVDKQSMEREREGSSFCNPNIHIAVPIPKNEKGKK